VPLFEIPLINRSEVVVLPYISMRSPKVSAKAVSAKAVSAKAVSAKVVPAWAVFAKAVAVSAKAVSAKAVSAKVVPAWAVERIIQKNNPRQTNNEPGTNNLK